MSSEVAYKLVLLRHGESTWNKSNQFTGWTDVDLSPEGEIEAKEAAKLLKESGFEFELAYSSVLKRSIRTLNIVLDELDLDWLPVTRLWRLNERHYGALQGLNKAETAEKHGEEQVKIWRRAFDIPPPPLALDDPRHPSFDKRYEVYGVPKDQLPCTESLKDTIARFIPAWEEEILPTMKSGKRVLIAAHGNSIRALIKHISSISDSDIVELNIPTAIPLVYEFDADFKPIRNYYLGDEEAVKAKAAAVAAQASAKK